MDVIRSKSCHGVSIIKHHGQSIVLAGLEVSNQEIAQCAQAVLPRRQWLDLHQRLFGGVSARTLLAAVLGGAVVVIVVAALIMGAVWTGWDRPRPGAPPAAAGLVPPASRTAITTAYPSSTSAASHTTAAGAGSSAQARPGGTQAPSSVPPTTGPISSTVSSIGSTVGGAASTVSSVVDDIDDPPIPPVSSVLDHASVTASSVVCRLVC